MTYDTITADIKTAMLSKDSLTRDTLRSLVSEIKNQTVNAGKDITEEIVIKCIQKSVKQHTDSITQFESAGRNDLAEKEKSELNVLNKYLPKMMSEDEIKTIIDNLTSSIEPIKKNMGLFMKNFNSPSIDKKFASKYLNSILN